MSKPRRLLAVLIGALVRALAVAALATALVLGPAGHAWAAASNTEASSPEFDVAVVEHLRVKVPAEARQAWLKAEQQSWDPWLRQQDGFLGRELLWDSSTEEGTLLIRWASRAQWKAIPQAEIDAVQQRFEQLARRTTGSEANPFPLVFEGELLPP
ncbi:MAG: TIGR03792 family protein [Cyanobacteriota bacterium]|nr:TIGR03792 family protein [Cyanobacteriota bacterium]